MPVALAGFRGHARGRVTSRSAADRLAVLALVAGAAVVLVVSRQLGDWRGWSVAVWAALVLLAAVCAVGIALRWPALPWRAAGRRGSGIRDALSTAGSVLVAVAAALVL